MNMQAQLWKLDSSRSKIPVNINTKWCAGVVYWILTFRHHRLVFESSHFLRFHINSLQLRLANKTVSEKILFQERKSYFLVKRKQVSKSSLKAQMRRYRLLGERLCELSRFGADQLDGYWQSNWRQNKILAARKSVCYSVKCQATQKKWSRLLY